MVIVAVGSLLSRRAAAHPNCASLKSVLPGRDNTLFGRTEVERRLQGSVQASGVYPRTAQDANRLTPMKVFRRDTHAAGTESGFGSAPPCVQLDDIYFDRIGGAAMSSTTARPKSLYGTTARRLRSQHYLARAYFFFSRVIRS